MFYVYGSNLYPAIESKRLVDQGQKTTVFPQWPEWLAGMFAMRLDSSRSRTAGAFSVSITTWALTVSLAAWAFSLSTAAWTFPVIAYIP
jgi:hypothetical protein